MRSDLEGPLRFHWVETSCCDKDPQFSPATSNDLHLGGKLISFLLLLLLPLLFLNSSSFIIIIIIIIVVVVVVTTNTTSTLSGGGRFDFDVV